MRLQYNMDNDTLHNRPYKSSTAARRISARLARDLDLQKWMLLQGLSWTSNSDCKQVLAGILQFYGT